MVEKTKEPQYKVCFDVRDRHGFSRFGLMSNQVWHEDPKRLVFLLSRYKFVAKMLAGKKRVLEVGCADAFGTRLVKQSVESILAVDFDPVFVEEARKIQSAEWPFDVAVHDMIEGPVAGQFDAAYTLDVIEHIDKKNVKNFVQHISSSLTQDGVMIVGLPSLESQDYASPASKAGHVNCMTADETRNLMLEFFENVFIFSMNDEVVHTGFSSMAHYIIALC